MLVNVFQLVKYSMVRDGRISWVYADVPAWYKRETASETPLPQTFNVIT
jgi:hypothetical protein